MSSIKLKTPSGGSIALVPADTATNVVLTVPVTGFTEVADLASPSGASLVGYMPAGVGAVATDVQTVLQEQQDMIQSLNARVESIERL